VRVGLIGWGNIVIPFSTLKHRNEIVIRRASWRYVTEVRYISDGVFPRKVSAEAVRAKRFGGFRRLLI
jgi:hypothetical protein